MTVSSSDNIFWFDFSYWFFHKFYNESYQKILDGAGNHNKLFDTYSLFLNSDLWQNLSNMDEVKLHNEIFLSDSIPCILFSSTSDIQLLVNNSRLGELEQASDILNKVTGILLPNYNSLPSQFRVSIDGSNIRLRQLYVSCLNTTGAPTSNTKLVTNIISEEELELVYNIFLYKLGETITLTINEDSLIDEIDNDPISISSPVLKYMLQAYLLYMNQDLDDKFFIILELIRFMEQFQGIEMEDLNKRFYKTLCFHFLVYLWFNVFQKLSNNYTYNFSW